MEILLVTQTDKQTITHFPDGNHNAKLQTITSINEVVPWKRTRDQDHDYVKTIVTLNFN